MNNDLHPVVDLNNYVGKHALNFLQKSELCLLLACQSGFEYPMMEILKEAQGLPSRLKPFDRLTIATLQLYHWMGLIKMEGDRFSFCQTGLTEKFRQSIERVILASDIKLKLLQSEELTEVEKELYQQVIIKRLGSRALLTHGSYLDMLHFMIEIAAGRPFGDKFAIKRRQPHNALAAGAMFYWAAKNLADLIVDLFDPNNTTVIEFASGNSILLALTASAYQELGLPIPQLIASDYNPKTEAETYSTFEKMGLDPGLVTWMLVDISDPYQVSEAIGTSRNGNKVVAHLGYAHESRADTISIIQALSESLRVHDTLALSDSYRLTNLMVSPNQRQAQIYQHPDYPLFFDFLHLVSAQDLMTEAEHVAIARDHQFIHTGKQVIHKAIAGHNINSTTLFELTC